MKELDRRGYMKRGRERMKYTAVRWKKRDRRKNRSCSIMSANMTHVPNDITYFCNKCNMNEIYKHMYIMYMYIYIYNERYSETESVKKREIEREKWKKEKN